ncbi:hypothetical protein [Fictibacillus sp. NRS-1165]
MDLVERFWERGTSITTIGDQVALMETYTVCDINKEYYFYKL